MVPKILIVEDNDINRLVIETVCNKLKLHTTCATNGLDAVRQIGKNSFDLIILDISLPYLDGLEFYKIMTKLNLTVPVIVQTAYSRQEDIDKFIDAGMDNILIKPYSCQDLRKKICILLGDKLYDKRDKNIENSRWQTQPRA